jgi:hypothetical protein
MTIRWGIGLCALAAVLFAAGEARATTMSQVSAGFQAGGGKNDANTKASGYHKGLAVFTIAKGGLMYTATVAGQKFTYTPRGGE